MGGGRPLFLSTPSARRATTQAAADRLEGRISIHALREEGDQCNQGRCIAPKYFYPRPPRGGRRSSVSTFSPFSLFLSTPSARRATGKDGDIAHHAVIISIHALREEGDQCNQGRCIAPKYFYPRPPRGGRRSSVSTFSPFSLFLSTPSARRATGKDGDIAHHAVIISIHALREEGDAPQTQP